MFAWLFILVVNAQPLPELGRKIDDALFPELHGCEALVAPFAFADAGLEIGGEENRLVMPNPLGSRLNRYAALLEPYGVAVQLTTAVDHLAFDAELMSVLIHPDSLPRGDLADDIELRLGLRHEAEHLRNHLDYVERGAVDPSWRMGYLGALGDRPISRFAREYAFELSIEEFGTFTADLEYRAKLYRHLVRTGQTAVAEEVEAAILAASQILSTFSRATVDVLLRSINGARVYGKHEDAGIGTHTSMWVELVSATPHFPASVTFPVVEGQDPSVFIARLEGDRRKLRKLAREVLMATGELERVIRIGSSPDRIVEAASAVRAAAWREN